MNSTEPKTTASAIADHIAEMILSDSLMPGVKLPSERALSERLSVSRAMIREGLRELQGRGFIYTEQGRGSFVNCLVSEPPDDAAAEQLLGRQAQSLYDVLEVREQLEAQAAYLAATRATQGDRYRISRAFETMQTSRWNAQLDHNFHQAILDACHNPVLVHTLASLKRLTLRSVEAAVDNLNHRPEFKRQIEKQHRQIYNAVINGQPDRARRAAVAHVRFLNEKLRQIQVEDSESERATR